MARPLRNGRRPFLTQLVWLLDRFGEDIEFDLAVLGLDLVELWHQRRFRFLLAAIHRLPRTSHTREAMANDEEFLEAVIGNAADEQQSSKAPRFVEFSAEVEALYAVIDRLGDVCAGLVGLGGKKPRKISPLPRPQTAYQRVLNRKRKTEHDALVARVLPPSS